MATVPRTLENIEKLVRRETTFILEDYIDYWRIYGAEHIDVKKTQALYVWDLLKFYLDGGKSWLPKEWGVISAKALEKKDFLVGSAPSHYSYFRTLYLNKEDHHYKSGIEEIRFFLERVLSTTDIATSSEGLYKPPVGLISVTHGMGLPNPHKVRWYMKGRTLYGAFLGTDCLSEINEVCRWLCKRDAYLEREEGIKVEERRAVRIGFYQNELREKKLGFLADTIPGFAWPALGMRMYEIPLDRPIQR